MARWQDYVLRDIRANQPSGSLVTIGTLFCVTDEGDIVERWDGIAWTAYSPIVGTGDVSGPASSIDSEIVLFSGLTGKIIKRATGTGVVKATSGVYSVGSINLATEVSGDLLYANLTPSSAASRLLGRGSSGAGDWQEISLGGNLSMTGTVLDSTGSASSTVARDTNGFRLTLASGQPVFRPQPATPSSTDTTNEIVTFSADPGWFNGTILTPASTLGGLTAGTTYYMHRITATTYSFHTTVAAAMSGASRVNLTASITQQLNPSGISTTGIYLTPYTSSQIALYDGYDWVLVDHAEMSVGLGTLSVDTNYDLFLDYNGGTPNLYIGAAWSSATARSVDIVRQDGVWVSSADSQSRYLGTFRTDSTTTVIDNAGGIITNVGGRRYLWNAVNRVRGELSVFDSTASWTYNSVTPQQARATAGNKCEIVIGLVTEALDAQTIVLVAATGTTAGITGIGVDVTNAFQFGSIRGYTGAAVTGDTTIASRWNGLPTIGYHAVNWLEAAANTNATTFVGNVNTAQSGLSVVSFY